MDKEIGLIFDLDDTLIKSTDVGNIIKRKYI